MRAVSSFDIDAQTQLVQRLQHRVKAVARAVLRDMGDLEGVTQTSLLQILRSAHTYRAEGPLESWADRIVARTAYRARKRELRFEGLLDRDANDPADRGSNADSATVVESFHEALGQLPEHVATLLMLKHVAGYTVEEICEMTNATTDQVKKRLVKANQTLRRRMRGDGVIGLVLRKGDA